MVPESAGRRGEISELLYFQGRDAGSGAHQLAVQIRRNGLGICPRPEKMVSAAVRCDAGGFELGQPGGPGRIKGDSPVLEEKGHSGVPVRCDQSGVQAGTDARRF